VVLFLCRLRFNFQFGMFSLPTPFSLFFYGGQHQALRLLLLRFWVLPCHFFLFSDYCIATIEAEAFWKTSGFLSRFFFFFPPPRIITCLFSLPIIGIASDCPIHLPPQDLFFCLRGLFTFHSSTSLFKARFFRLPVGYINTTGSPGPFFFSLFTIRPRLFCVSSLSPAY